MGMTTNVSSYNNIKPVGDNFRELPFHKAFTWKDGIPVGTENHYIVHFYSVRHPKATPEVVKELIARDYAATLEAQKQKGFLLYCHDDEVKDGIGSSFCIWESAEDARNASHKPGHMHAVRYVAESMSAGTPVYLEYTINKYRLDRPSEEKIKFTLVGEMTYSPESIARMKKAHEHELNAVK